MLLLALLILPVNSFAAGNDYGQAKNVILMIPDGMSVEAVTMTRWMTEDGEFVFDSWATGLVKTHNANTPIADSAPAGTAMATGIKSQSPYVGTYPSKGGIFGAEGFEESKKMMPIATLLEGAERLGKSTGIISTSNIQYATLAGFSSHNPNRNNYEDLGEQQVYQDIKVVLGGGSSYLSKKVRKDKEDLIGEIKSLGYDYVTTRDQLEKSNSNKLWGMFAETSMAYDIDRDSSVEPSLKEMTSKALSILEKNNKGFFLMVEGSQPDWAGHANNPVGMKSEIFSFNEAVKVAKDFADKNKDTVVIIASDHGTGGLTIGHRDITKGYDKEPLETFTHIIKNAKLTGAGFEGKLDENRSNISALVKEVYGFEPTSEEVKLIKDSENVQQTVGTIISDRSMIGWTTGGHVGGDVALYCYTSGNSV